MAALSIVTALTNLKAAGEMVKALREADGAFDKAELKVKVATLAESLADARIAVLDAQEELEQMRQRVLALEAAQGARANLVIRHNVYWFESGESTEGPFCPSCFESAKVRMPVSELPDTFRDLARYRCPKCRATY